MVSIKKEKWKRLGFVWVVRDKNKRLVTWTTIKRSGFKTKKNALLHFRETKSLKSIIKSRTEFRSGTIVTRSTRRTQPKDRSQLILKFDVFVNGKKIKKQAFGYSRRLSDDPDPEKTAMINAQRSIRQKGIAMNQFKYSDKVEVKRIKDFKEYWNFKFRQDRK